MRSTVVAAMLLVASASAAVLAQTPVAAAPAAAGYSVEDTDLGTLLDDPAAKAILDKNLPGFTATPQIDMARSLTLKGLQQYMSDTLTDVKLAAIQADLSKLPAKK